MIRQQNVPLHVQRCFSQLPPPPRRGGAACASTHRVWGDRAHSYAPSDLSHVRALKHEKPRRHRASH